MMQVLAARGLTYQTNQTSLLDHFTVENNKAYTCFYKTPLNSIKLTKC